MKAADGAPSETGEAEALREIAVKGDARSVFVEIEDLAARLEGFPNSEAWALAARASQPSPVDGGEGCD